MGHECTNGTINGSATSRGYMSLRFSTLRLVKRYADGSYWSLGVLSVEEETLK